MKTFDLNSIQQAIRSYKFDGWLFYDFHGNDKISLSILNVSSDPAQYNRWFYYVPARGIPVKILHSFDLNLLDHLPGRKQVYFSWQELEDKLKLCFKPKQKIAVQYSPRNAIPYLSRLDAGTFELLKSFKIKPVSSANLVQLCEARLTKGQVNTHINAAKLLHSINKKSVQFIKKQINDHLEINDCIIQDFIVKQLEKNGLIFDRKPKVACGTNTGNPHYVPVEKKPDPIFPGKLLQLQISGKLKEERSVYAVISWVYYLDKNVPEKLQQIFAVISEARDLAVDNIDNAIKKGKKIQGWKIDDDVSKFLTEAGYKQYILHNTGHSLGTNLYGNGANIDNLETKEDRELIAGTCFTIEPGLYFSDYGMQTGINLYIDNEGTHVYTQPVQQEIIPILTD